jgi:hypothetical protein
MNSPRRFSPEVEALLESNRVVLPLSPSVEARVLARAAATAASTTPWRTWEVGPVSVDFHRAPRRIFAAAAGLTLVIGAAAYAAHAWHRSPSPAPTPTTVTTRPVARAADPMPAAVAAPREPEAREDVPLRTIAVRTPSIRPRPASSHPSNAELQLLLRARRAMTAGDFAAALLTVGEHAHRFPTGSLVEEREALRVRSLAGLGRQADAQRAAAAFHARFPRSVLLSTFDRIGQPSP